MTIYEEVKEHMKRNAKTRERSNKDKFICWILAKKYGIGGRPVTEYLQLTAICKDYASYDRAWRAVLQHEPSLRGTDYDDKAILEQEKELELGYQPTVSADKMIKNI